MTKTIKLSLAAVMAAGIATSASAQDLSEAIKNVDVSGYVDFRKEYKSTEGVKKADVNEYGVNLTLTSKVNDIVSATVALGFDEVQTINTGTGETSGTHTAVTTEIDPAPGVESAYFTFGLGNTTLMAGKQSIPSVFVDEVDTAKSGTGLVALHKVSDALTVAGAHFTATNFAADVKTTELIAMGKVADVSLQANYNMTDAGVNAEATRLYLKAGTAVSGVSVGAEYASADVDGAAGKATNTKVYASGKVANVSLTALYGTVGKDNTKTNSVSIDNDNDAKSETKVWQLSSTNVKYGATTFQVADATVMMLAAAMPVTDTVKAGLKYATASVDNLNSGATTAKGDASEMLLTVDYKMSKNFTLHARYSELSVEPDGASSEKTKYSRLQAKYTF